MNNYPVEQPKVERLERLANPEWKEEYEMPEWYQKNLQQFTELLESREEYKKKLSSLPPKAYAEALPFFEKLDRAVETLEERLAIEYENYQEEQRREQELCELTWDYESMSEELFIWVKHKKPYLFEQFIEYAAEGMTEEELKEHHAVIERREAEELETILANPKPPAIEYENLYVKHRLPDPWISEMLLGIVNQAFTHDEFFEINFDALERLEKTLYDYRFHVSRALPVRRRNMEEALLDLKKPLESGKRFLLDYAEEAINKGKFKLKESGFTKYINDYPKYLENCLYWKYILIKHTQPEKLEEFTRIVTEDLTPEETAEFFKRAAEVDETDSDEILESLEWERITTERVETRRAAPGYKKIEGPELSPRVKDSIARHKEQAQKRESETPPEKISRETPELFNRYLKIYHAVTGNQFPPERYEDEQSRKDEELGKMFEQLEETSNKLYLIIKHQKPHLFEEFHHITTQDMTPEELEEFQKKIAHLEATRLDEILAGK